MRSLHPTTAVFKDARRTRHGHSASSWPTISRGSAQTWENPPGRSSREALAALGIETRLGIDIASISPSGVMLTSGEEIPAATVVWCAGMRANPLTRLFPVEPDHFGRIPVDAFMRVTGVANVFAAGDVACAMMDDSHASVMS